MRLAFVAYLHLAQSVKQKGTKQPVIQLLEQAIIDTELRSVLMADAEQILKLTPVIKY